MKIVTLRDRHSHRRYIGVPETWDEGYDMIADALQEGLKGGKDSALSSVCERVVFGLFNIEAPNPRTAMAFLMQRICEREGAGLDAEDLRKNQSARR
jgi:hypothetical protein